MPGLTAVLQKNIQQVDLHQLYRLLQQSGLDASALFRPANSLLFPSRTIISFTADETHPVIELSCLGLHGVSSPLPHYFITDALEDANVSLRAFLEIFNQSIYRAYFNAWCNQHPYLFKKTAMRGLEFISLLGSSDIDFVRQAPCLAPLFLLQQRSVHGLKALVQLVYPGIPFELKIQDCEWLSSHQPARLGSLLRLSDNLTLGHRIPCYTHRLKLIIGPVDDLQSIIQSRVHWLQAYLNHALMIDIDWKLGPKIHSSTLGGKMHLGWASTLGGSHAS